MLSVAVAIGGFIAGNNYVFYPAAFTDLVFANLYFWAYSRELRAE